MALAAIPSRLRAVVFPLSVFYRLLPDHVSRPALVPVSTTPAPFVVRRQLILTALPDRMDQLHACSAHTDSFSSSYTSSSTHPPYAGLPVSLALIRRAIFYISSHSIDDFGGRWVSLWVISLCFAGPEAQLLF